MMSRCAFWLLLCLPAMPATAQTPVQDSLLRVARGAATDSMRLALMLDYARSFISSDSARSLSLMDSLLTESRRSGYEVMAADIMVERAIVYYVRGDYINSIALHEQAEQAFLQLPDSYHKTTGLAAIQNNLGAAYSLINDMEPAYEAYRRSIESYTAIGDSANLVTTWFNLAFLYIDIQDWKQAAAHLQRSISYYNGGRGRGNYVQSLARKAAMHFRMGEVERGRQLLDKANTEGRLTNDPLAAIYLRNAAGEYHAATGRWQQAAEEHLAGLRLSEAYGDPYYVTDQAREAGRAFTQLGRYDSASSYLRYALGLARQYQYLPKVKFILQDMAELLARQGKHEQAYGAALHAMAFADSLVGIQNHNRLLLNEARFQSGIKEQRISSLEQTTARQSATIRQQSLLNYLLGILALALGIILLLAYRNYRQKQQLQQRVIRQLETDKQLLAADALLQGEEKERTRIARELHDGLGGMLSGIRFSMQHLKQDQDLPAAGQKAFDRALGMLDNSIRELRRVAHNMMPEALVKFGLDAALRDFCAGLRTPDGPQIDYHSLGLDAEPQPDRQTATGVYRIVQELVHNSLKHAGASHVLVQVTRQDGHLTLTVEDNGRGFDVNDLGQKAGMGLSSIRSRAEYLQGRLDIRSAPGEGTSVHAEFDL